MKARGWGEDRRQRVLQVRLLLWGLGWGWGCDDCLPTPSLCLTPLLPRLGPWPPFWLPPSFVPGLLQQPL